MSDGVFALRVSGRLSVRCPTFADRSKSDIETRLANLRQRL